MAVTEDGWGMILWWILDDLTQGMTWRRKGKQLGHGGADEILIFRADVKIHRSVLSSRTVKQE